VRSGEQTGNENGLAAPRLVLQLYVAGDAPNSVRAVANLRAICRRWLETDEYQLEIIDVLREPRRALEAGILVTPTLLGSASGTVSLVGTLDDHERVREALGLGRAE